MNITSFSIPMMYGDHHVLAVRQLLLALPGVENVYASSSFQVVEVEYDEAKLDVDAIKSVLAEAGYLAELPVPVEIGTDQANPNGKPFFRHTAVFAQTGKSISFGQELPAMARPLWPCPGLDR